MATGALQPTLDTLREMSQQTLLTIQEVYFMINEKLKRTFMD